MTTSLVPVRRDPLTGRMVRVAGASVAAVAPVAPVAPVAAAPVAPVAAPVPVIPRASAAPTVRGYVAVAGTFDGAARIRRDAERRLQVAVNLALDLRRCRTALGVSVALASAGFTDEARVAGALPDAEALAIGEAAARDAERRADELRAALGW